MLVCYILADVKLALKFKKILNKAFFSNFEIHFFFSFNKKLLGTTLLELNLMILVDVRNETLIFLDFDSLGRGLVTRNYFILIMSPFWLADLRAFSASDGTSQGACS